MSINRIQSDQLIIELSQLFTKATCKPECYVMMAQTGGKTLFYVGGNKPLV
ncbi:MAG: hypothetical protein PHY54_15615 [Methylococcales bacterium]|nr:hypothetical protein [Methylococcales bacterium]